MIRTLLITLLLTCFAQALPLEQVGRYQDPLGSSLTLYTRPCGWQLIARDARTRESTVLDLSPAEGRLLYSTWIRSVQLLRGSQDGQILGTCLLVGNAVEFTAAGQDLLIRTGPALLLVPVLTSRSGVPLLGRLMTSLAQGPAAATVPTTSHESRSRRQFDADRAGSTTDNRSTSAPENVLGGPIPQR